MLAIDADAAWFTVGVDGPGMVAETAAHVLDRFYRADASRTGASANSGLGSSIAAAIVAAHDGTIDVETAPGRGASFTVRLPRHAGSGGQPAGIPETARPTT